MSDPNTDRPAAPASTPPLVEPNGARPSQHPIDPNGPPTGPDAGLDAAAEAEQDEANRQNSQRLAEDRARADRLAADRAEADRAEADRAEADRAEAGRAEADSAEAERADAERAQTERADAERAQTERADAERAQTERADAERAQADRAEPRYSEPLPAAALSTEPDPIESRREYDSLADGMGETRVHPIGDQAANQYTATDPNGAPTAHPSGDTAAAVPAQEQRVFVRPPLEPKRRGNRGIGSVIAITSVLVFAALFAIIGAIIILIGVPDQELGAIVLRFIGSPTFFVPALFFVVGFVLLVLVLNRANWWTYIVGSLVVAAVVYFGTIGVRLLADNIVTMTPDDAARRFAAYAANPFVIAAAFAAREVVIWFGAIIAARGRRVKAANVTARQQHALASEQYRAEFERGYTPGA